MGPRGPEPDMALMLSGHPAQMPPPPIDRKMAESKGIGATQTLTAWWGRGVFLMLPTLLQIQQGLAVGKKNNLLKHSVRVSLWVLTIQGQYYHLCHGKCTKV